ncbi:MAG TPA: type II secretion system F family protein [Pirellulaceae bacterium]|jgi:type II secretory pathway component PulF|nr:type II secretion system F family protein [Pirellulaceae bacterium]
MSIGHHSLASLCRRLGESLKAGVDLRSFLQRESTRVSPMYRQRMTNLYDRLMAGDTFAEAVRRQGTWFPPLLSEMVEVGERSGRLDEALLQLADYYEMLVRTRREFLVALAWPLIQFFAAVVIVSGLLILLEFIAPGRIDVSGLGIHGFSAAGLFLLVVGLLTTAIVLPVVAVLRGWLGPLPISMAGRVPGLKELALSGGISRFSWTLSAGIDAGLDAKDAMGLALRSSRQPLWMPLERDIARQIQNGNSFHDALASTGRFSDDLLIALDQGEMTGRVPETMREVSREYHERWKTAVRIASVIAAFIVWALVAAMIIVLIFRLFWVAYLGPLYDALEMVK